MHNPVRPHRRLAARRSLTLMFAAALALAGLSFAPDTAGAAVVVRHDLTTLVADADLIATGRVVNVESHFKQGRIVTRVTLRCRDVVKGEPADEVVVEVPGGRVGQLGQKVAGVARFAQDEEVVVFLARAPVADADVADANVAAGLKPVHTVVGLSQGKLRVEPTFDGPVVVRELQGLTTVLRLPDGQLQEVAPAVPARQPLGDFVRDLVRLTAAQSR